MPEPGRQGRDMPTEPRRSHADHNFELVAAHAAGDLEGAQREAADALLAACPACRELAGDLRAIATATAALPAPARTRDFRLRPEDAARLRPRGWRRLAAALGSSRLELTRPIAPVLMTLGVVGLLVSGIPLFQGSASSAAPQLERAGAAAGSDAGGALGAASAAPAAAAASPAASRNALPDNGGGQSAAPSGKAGGLFGAQASSSPSRIGDTAGEAYAQASETPPATVSAARSAQPGSAAPEIPLAALSAAALIVGLVLFGLRRALEHRPTR
jgi:hypothetical protein